MPVALGGQRAWQQPLDALREHAWDALVAGAGPAGAITALNLASQGYRVLLVDKARFPREKPCGDALVADAVRCLRRAGLLERVRRLAREAPAATAVSSSGVEVDLPGPYLTLRRAELDRVLAEGAARAGAVVCHAQVRDLRGTDEGTVVASFEGTAREACARTGVVATGASLALARRFDAGRRRLPAAVGVRRYVRSTFRLDRLLAFYDPWILPGYAWVFPVGDDEYNVGCAQFHRGGHAGVRDLRAAFEKAAGRVPLAKAVLDQCRDASPWRAAMLRCGLRGARPLLARNVLAVGETIGATLPLTGEGIGAAMETGEMAAAAIHAALTSGRLEALAEYPRRIEQRFRPRHLAYAAAERCATIRWLNDTVARTIRNGSFTHALAASVVGDSPRSAGVALLRGAFRALAKARAWASR